MPTSQITVTQANIQTLTVQNLTVTSSETAATIAANKVSIAQAFILTRQLLQATGTNSQSAAAPVTAPAVVVTTVSSPTRGIRLPVAMTGLTELITNAGSNSVHVFPASGARIGNAATNAAINVGAGKGSIFFAQDAKTWRVIAGA